MGERMKIDPKKFTTDESKSNPYIVAIVYSDCPIKGVCTYSGQSNCKYLKIINDENAECSYDRECYDSR